MTYTYPDFPNITVDPEVCMGKPVLAGTRMPVSSLLGYLGGGMSVDEFVQEFSWITHEQIAEALAFAAVMLDERFVPLRQAS
jgi:uncharacterized protein (DUF433 family)